MSKVLGGERIRTDSVEGEAFDLPQVGKPFVIEAPSSLIVDGIRLVNTSAIQTITEETDKVFIIKTMNSTYKVEVLEE